MVVDFEDFENALACFRGEETHGFYLAFDIRGFEACLARSMPSCDRDTENGAAHTHHFTWFGGCSVHGERTEHQQSL